MTEYALENSRTTDTVFALRLSLLQLLQPLEGVEELTIRTATRGIKPLRAVRYECPKMTGINPLQGILELKDGIILGSRREKLNNGG